MPEFYYQIKGRKLPGEEGMSNWSWPPLYSNKIEANDKKHAKSLIEEEFGRSLPTRVLQKDWETNNFLLYIEELRDNDHRRKFFDIRKCLYCENQYRPIDKYNDPFCDDKSHDYCSYKCKSDHYHVNIANENYQRDITGKGSPIIYKITNKVTGLIYIGKTSQQFTLRWYQHFFQYGDCKFHTAIKESKLTDWNFEIIEIIELPDNIKLKEEMDDYILERESYWINHFDSVRKGYNTMGNKNTDQMNLFEESCINRQST